MQQLSEFASEAWDADEAIRRSFLLAVRELFQISNNINSYREQIREHFRSIEGHFQAPEPNEYEQNKYYFNYYSQKLEWQQALWKEQYYNKVIPAYKILQEWHQHMGERMLQMDPIIDSLPYGDNGYLHSHSLRI